MHNQNVCVLPTEAFGFFVGECEREGVCVPERVFVGVSEDVPL